MTMRATRQAHVRRFSMAGSYAQGFCRGKFGPRLWLLLAWMACIYLLSAQPGTQSAGLSQAVAMFLADCISSIAHFFGIDSSLFSAPDLIAILHPFVRKAAHATEYAILAMLLAYWLEAFIAGQRRITIIALGIACLYAALDEAHQLLVPGRAGQAMDVAIDASGAFAGLLLFRCIGRGMRMMRSIRQGTLRGAKQKRLKK